MAERVAHRRDRRAPAAEGAWRDEARAKARELFERFPQAAYMTEIESWRELAGDESEFMMRRRKITFIDNA